MSLTPQVTGLAFGDVAGRQLWDTFVAPWDADSEPFATLCEMAARGDDFVVRGARLRARPRRGAFTLSFRCGAAPPPRGVWRRALLPLPAQLF